MLKFNEKNYSYFSPIERVNLTIAALSRGDAEEARKLYKTCPKCRYLATDYEFTKRLDAIAWVGEKYAELCQYYYDKILIAQGAISAMILGGKDVRNRMTLSVEDMEEARVGHAGSLKAVYAALIEFCDEVGVDGMQLMEWMIPPSDCGDMRQYLAMSDGVDHELAAYIKQKFHEHWGNGSFLR